MRTHLSPFIRVAILLTFFKCTAVLASQPDQSNRITTPPLSLRFDIVVSAVIDDVLTGTALVEDNTTNSVPADTPPTLMIWSADLKDHFGQKCKLVQCDPPAKEETDQENGNRILMWDLSRSLSPGTTITVRRVYEITNACYDPQLKPETTLSEYRPGDPAVAFYTRQEPYVELTDEITSAAKAAIGTEKHPIEKARRLFRFTQQYLHYVYPPPGGRGAAVAWDQHAGDCGQYADLFVALSRSIGLPARFAGGFALGKPQAGDTVTTTGSHAWAELMLPDGVWIPVDATLPEETNFGRTLDMEHLTASVGRNIQLPGAPEWANTKVSDLVKGRTPFMQTFTEVMTGVKGRISSRKKSTLIKPGR